MLGVISGAQLFTVCPVKSIQLWAVDEIAFPGASKLESWWDNPFLLRVKNESTCILKKHCTQTKNR